MSATRPPDRRLALLGRRVRRWRAGGLGPRWVVAVSGGGDSVGLLRALLDPASDCGLDLSVAHLDHGIRGDAGRADAEAVRDLAGSLGLAFDLGQWSPARAGHFEADARRARYQWLAEVASRRGAAAVAVGQTRDDQAETVLHRVLRGTGVAGLAGIPERRPLGPGLTLVRPLLDVTRAEVRDYLGSIGQPFAEDATNADTRRTRARLRHDLLPKLAEEYNPRVVEALVRLARLAAGSARVGRHRIGPLDRLAAWSADGLTVALDREALGRLPPTLRAEAVRLAWRRAGWPEVGMGERRWRRLARLSTRSSPGRFDVGGGVVAETGLGPGLGLILRRPRSEPVAAIAGPQPVALPGSAGWSGGRLVVTLDPAEPRDETVDFDRMVPPALVRAPDPGDRFGPLGMAGRGQPLNDFFRGRRVPPEARASTPLLCDAAGVVWVVGHRIADRVRLTPATVRPAGLRWEPPAPPPGRPETWI